MGYDSSMNPQLPGSMDVVKGDNAGYGCCGYRCGKVEFRLKERNQPGLARLLALPHNGIIKI